jgi:hypothetical protein
MVFFVSGGFLEMVGGVRIYRRTIARIRQTQAIDDGRPAVRTKFSSCLQLYQQGSSMLY